MKTRTKIIVSLIMLAIMDVIIPIPVLGIMLIYVVFQKPAWFSDTVRDIYGS